MPREHWFDTLLKAMHGISRRDIARGGAMLLPGLLVGALTVPEAAGKQHKKKGNKGKGNGKKPNKHHKPNKPNKPQKPDKPKVPRVCEAYWPDEGEEQEWCRRTHDETCPQDNLEFCVTWSDEHSDFVAKCCNRGQFCCSERCCASPCCGTTCGPTPNTDEKCCNGIVADTASHPSHCGRCGKSCRANEECVNSECVCFGPDCPSTCRTRDSRDCSLPCFDRNCPEGQRCILNDQYYCDGDSSPDCECGCGLNYEYKQCRDGWRCVSQGANC
jgi:hypothetical protein